MATAPFMTQLRPGTSSGGPPPITAEYRPVGDELPKGQTVRLTYQRPQVTTFFLVIVVIVVVATMVCRRLPLVDKFPRPPHIRMDLPDVRRVIHSNGDNLSGLSGDPIQAMNTLRLRNSQSRWRRCSHL
ncbi:hypothetical protein B0H13DRAFT_2351630 [Mycena leptocephala]|nr:hypothetical protein B0H13DRAFT_2351630 [Mycena leptocephala]